MHLVNYLASSLVSYFVGSFVSYLANALVNTLAKTFAKTAVKAPTHLSPPILLSAPAGFIDIGGNGPPTEKSQFHGLWFVVVCMRATSLRAVGFSTPGQNASSECSPPPLPFSLFITRAFPFPIASPLDPPVQPAAGQGLPGVEWYGGALM